MGKMEERIIKKEDSLATLPIIGDNGYMGRGAL